MGVNALHKSVHLGVGTHQLATREVERLNAVAKQKSAGKQDRRTLTACLDSAVHYFAERGLDPAEVHEREGARILQEVRRLGDRVFSYLQDQERHVHQAVLHELVRTRVTQQVVLAALQDVEGQLNGLSPDQINGTRAQDVARIERDAQRIMTALDAAAKDRRGNARTAEKKTGTASQ